MALEAVVFQQDPFSYGFKDLHTLGGSTGVTAPWSCGFGFEEELLANYENLLQNGGFGFNSVNSDSSMVQQSTMTNVSSSTDHCTYDGLFKGDFPPVEAPAESSSCRRKRRRTRSAKNKEEVENQRMTHIAVERNRRKQMNDYLSVLRSLMPPSYIQRGDQASIIGGAINYVKELEQLLQSLEAHKRNEQQSDAAGYSFLFSDFFSFPQYSTLQSMLRDQSMASEKQSAAIADVEVTMVETHANLKILTKRHPKQLLKMVTGLHSLGLNVLHLNVTAADQMILYSFSVKVEENCQLSSVNEIAAAVYEIVGKIQEDRGCFKLDDDPDFIM